MAIEVGIEENRMTDRFDKGRPYLESFIQIFKQTRRYSCKNCGICCYDISETGVKANWIDVENNESLHGSNGSRPIWKAGTELIEYEGDFGHMMKICSYVTPDGCLLQDEKFRLCKLFYCDKAYNDASNVHFELGIVTGKQIFII